MKRPIFVRVCGVVLLIGAGAAFADPLSISPRPLANPRQMTAIVEGAAAQTTPQEPVETPSIASDIPGASKLAVALSTRPVARPKGLETEVKPAPPAVAPPAAPVRGQLCGIPGLEGKPIAPIGGSKGCGLVDGVQVTAVSGIKLSMPAKIDCTTAKALKSWVDNGIVPAIGTMGGGVKRLEIAGSYVCRTRNHQKGAKVSEHGRGKAVDLSGVMLRDGRVLTVTKDWKRTPKIMHEIHRSACGTFGTVLGPKSDKFHFDHIHVDTARYTYGAYCR